MSKLLRVFHVFCEQTIAQMSLHLHKFSRKYLLPNYIYKEMAANKFYNSLADTLYFLSSKPSLRIQLCRFLTQLELKNMIRSYST